MEEMEVKQVHCIVGLYSTHIGKCN